MLAIFFMVPPAFVTVYSEVLKSESPKYITLFANKTIYLVKLLKYKKSFY